MSQYSLQSPHHKQLDPLVLALDRFQHVLAESVSGREGQWVDEVGGALARVEMALRQHRAGAKDPDGLLADVDETRPTLARQADELRRDHDGFLMQVMALRDEVHGAAEALQLERERRPKAGGSEGTDLDAVRQL